MTQAEYFQLGHVHTWDDGRGQRRVLIDGVECTDVRYADTELGIVLMSKRPLRVLPGSDYIDQRAVFGVIRVEPMEG